jgi:hypothetical protein
MCWTAISAGRPGGVTVTFRFFCQQKKKRKRKNGDRRVIIIS